jgi:hypothetical protein
VSADLVGALHMLHLFALSHGGPVEIKLVLSMMARQCRQLGAHRYTSARCYPPEEEVTRLFYLTLYKDTSVAPPLDLVTRINAPAGSPHYTRPTRA